MTTAAEEIYPRLPVALQNAACSLWGLREARVRFGRSFRERLAWLIETEAWSREEIAAYQDERIGALVRHAYEQIPYYRGAMETAGIVPSDIRNRTDLSLLPILTKEDVRGAGDALRARNASARRLRLRHTSGTTGKGLQFLQSKDALAFQWAVWWRHRNRFGLRQGDWHVNFLGQPAVPVDQRRPPWWRWNLPMHQVLVPMQQITAPKVRDLLRLLDSREFVYWSGYPSFVHRLSHLAGAAGLDLRRPPRVITGGAEAMYEFQRREIASFVPTTTLTTHYGLTESCGNAAECELHRLHVDVEFCFLECVDPEPQPDGSIRGRIVATGFACPEFPFIRYDTGDIGRWAPESTACGCGRQSPVMLSVEGRTEDYILTPEGRRIMRLDYVFKDAVQVKEAQVVQERLGEVTIRVVGRPGYGAEDERHLRREMAHWVSSQLEIHFEYVEEIERETSGKFRAVRSLLPADERTRVAV